ncbi:MAG: hypothetical protein QM767_18405 [Anaeromyxobacter sp.]
MRSHRHLWVLVAALVAGCGDYGAPDSVVYGTAVYTQPKPGFDFNQDLTSNAYFLDPLLKIQEDQESTTQDLPANVAAAINTQLQALGYTPVDTLGAAAVGVKVSVLKGTGTVWYPGYWCDYWYAYYGCYYDWYYAGSYKFGTVILEMGDLTAPDNGKLPILWLSAIYGVATTPTNDSQRVVDGIDRAFAQSASYLKLTP